MEKKDPYFDTTQSAYVAQQANYGGPPPSYNLQQHPAYGGPAPPYSGPATAPNYGGPTMATNYGSAQPVYVRPLPPAPVYQPPQNIGCWQRNRMNKPQSNSVGAASLIFMSGGMGLAWSFQYVATPHMRLSWFIGAIIGAIISSVVVNSVQKKLIYLCSAALVVLNGILFVSLPYNYEAVISARYLNGFAVGLAFTTCIVMAGEEPIKSIRGRLAASTETMSFSLGIYIELIYTSTWSHSNNQVWHGGLNILYGCIALLITFFLVVESPVFFLVRNDEPLAIDSLRRLQQPYIVTQQTYDQLEDHKRYIAFNNELTIAQSAVAGLPALLKLCFYRALVAMSFTMLVSKAFTSSRINPGWPTIVFGTLRWIGVLISSLLLDTVGRKKTMLVGGLICSGMAIGLGVIVTHRLRITDYVYFSDTTTVMALLFVFQFFAGVFISASSAYLTEAFPLAIKPYYITTVFVVEMLVQIVVCSVHLGPDSLSDYFYAVGALFFIFFILGFTTIPETMGTPLLEAQQKFSQRISNSFN